MAIQFKHLGIHVHDLERMVAFYTDMFGFVVSDYSYEGPLRIAFLTLSPEDHHQVVLIAGRGKNVVSKDLLNQISYKTDSLEEVVALYRKATEQGLEDIEPATHGNSWSCYFRDPEGNRQEVYCDTPWYISQPHFTPLDFSQPVEAIRARTEAIVRADPSFRPRGEWSAELRTKIEAKLANRKTTVG